MSKIKSPIKQEKIVDDKVLQALNQYNNTATPEQKESDLNKLEKECLSTVDAYDYVNNIVKQLAKLL